MNQKEPFFGKLPYFILQCISHSEKKENDSKNTRQLLHRKAQEKKTTRICVHTRCFNDFNDGIIIMRAGSR